MLCKDNSFKQAVNNSLRIVLGFFQNCLSIKIDNLLY